MSLDILLEPVPDRVVVRKCKIGNWAADLPEKYQTALNTLLFTTIDEGGLSNPELRERLIKAGLDVGETVLHKHRKQRCACN